MFTSIEVINVVISDLKFKIVINNRLVFKIKDGYKLGLQTLETMKLLLAQKINRQNKKRRKRFI